MGCTDTRAFAASPDDHADRRTADGIERRSDIRTGRGDAAGAHAGAAAERGAGVGTEGGAAAGTEGGAAARTDRAHGRRAALQMSAAQAVALAAAVGAYFVYSQRLPAAEFGLYAGALAVAKLGTTVLDGGLKTALIKHRFAATPAVQRALFIGSAGAAAAACLLLGATLWTAQAAGLMAPASALFFGLYAGAYFVAQPLLFVPLAQLERAQRYAPVAGAEAASIALEYGLPALLLLVASHGAWWWPFAVAAWAARALRSALLLAAAADRRWLRRRVEPAWRDAAPLWREGVGIQAALAWSMLRDSLHLVLVGPWFGAEWAGLYAWAMQLTALASQVFVQTAARVGLPALRALPDPAARWHATLAQIGTLTAWTAPPLLLLTGIAAAADSALFGGRWDAAVALLPWLVLRMAPSLATTPLGSLVLADAGARAFARANALWTLAELGAAALCLALFGPLGLAVSLAAMAWAGAALFVCALPAPAHFGALAVPLLCRPALAGAVVALALQQGLSAFVGLQHSLGASLLYGVVASAACIALERPWRRHGGGR